MESVEKAAYLAALITDGFNADNIALEALATQLSHEMETKVLVSSTTDVGVPLNLDGRELYLIILTLQN